MRMDQPDPTTLAMGTDLTTLGLNLNSPEQLYRTFASPWADRPLDPEPEFKARSSFLSLNPDLDPEHNPISYPDSPTRTRVRATTRVPV